MIAGNWKMFKTLGEALSFAGDLKGRVADAGGTEILLCPASLYIAPLAGVLTGSAIQVGAQNVFWEDSGAFTGEESAPMLRSAGATHTLIGHSERRQLFHETDETVNKRLNAALKGGLVPIVCVGETLEEREAGNTTVVVDRQVRQGLAGLGSTVAASIVVAYEPVWAIGTGKTATPELAQEVHAFIRKTLTQLFGDDAAGKIRILYGGSVKPDNVDALMAQQDIDGALVGGASLDAASFERIIRFKR
jgi:triosephosphate isomerase (TIM)